MWEIWVPSLGWKDPLEKGKATHSSILAWRIPWTIQSMESHLKEFSVFCMVFRFQWVSFVFALYLWVRKIPWGRAWQPIPVFLPGESHGQKATVHGFSELDTAEQQTLSLSLLMDYLAKDWPAMPLTHISRTLDIFF